MATVDEIKIVVKAEVDAAIAKMQKLDDVNKTNAKTGIDLAKSIAGYTSAYGLAVSAGQAVIKGTAELIKNSVTLAAAQERLKMEFSVLTGSMETGNKLFAEMNKLAAQTPLELENLTAAGKQLLSVGIPVDQITTKLRMLGDVAMGNPEKLDRLTSAFGQLRSKGVASMEQLNRFIEAGVPIMAELEKQTGKTGDEVFKMVSQGKVGYSEVEKALKALTSEGGLMHDMMARVATTAEGKYSAALDNAKLKLAEIGKGILPIATSALDWFNTAMDKAALASMPLIDRMVKIKEEANKIIGPINTLNENHKISGEQIAALVKQYPELTGVMDSYNTTLSEASRLVDEVVRKQAAAQVENEKRIADQLTTLAGDRVKRLKEEFGITEKQARAIEVLGTRVRQQIDNKENSTKAEEAYKKALKEVGIEQLSAGAAIIGIVDDLNYYDKALDSSRKRLVEQNAIKNTGIILSKTGISIAKEEIKGLGKIEEATGEVSRATQDIIRMKEILAQQYDDEGRGKYIEDIDTTVVALQDAIDATWKYTQESMELEKIQKNLSDIWAKREESPRGQVGKIRLLDEAVFNKETAKIKAFEDAEMERLIQIDKLNGADAQRYKYISYEVANAAEIQRELNRAMAQYIVVGEEVAFTDEDIAERRREMASGMRQLAKFDLFSVDYSGGAKSGWDDFSTFLDEAWAKEKKLEEQNKALAESFAVNLGGAFEAAGSALAKGEDAFKAWGRAGLSAIAGVVRALGAQYAVEAAGAWASVIGGQFWKTGEAVEKTGASALAYAGAGMIEAIPMAKGGSGITNGPTMFLAGETGNGREPFAFGSAVKGRTMVYNDNRVIQNIAGSVRSDRELRGMAVGAMANAGRGY